MSTTNEAKTTTNSRLKYSLIGVALALLAYLVAAQMPAPTVAPEEVQRSSAIIQQAGKPSATFAETLLEESGCNPVAPYAPASPIKRGYSYETLSPAQKRAYDQIAWGIAARLEEFSIRANKDADLRETYVAVFADNPEFFWSDPYSFTVTDHSKYMVIEPEYNVELEDINTIQKLIDERIEAALAGVPEDLPTYDKVRYAYEWVVLNTEYAQDAPHDQNIQSVFLSGISKCGGYAHAFQMLCHKMGVPCAFILGETTESGTHAWNMVEIDGVNTLVDPTWGDPLVSAGNEAMTVNYDYLCLTSEELLRDRVATDPSQDKLPVCDNDDFDFYNLNNSHLEVFIAEDLQILIDEAIEAGQNTVAIKLESDADFTVALEYVESGGMLLGSLANSETVMYATNETLRTIHIWW